jgi:hypothetical protein
VHIVSQVVNDTDEHNGLLGFLFFFHLRFITSCSGVDATYSFDSVCVGVLQLHYFLHCVCIPCVWITTFVFEFWMQACSGLILDGFGWSTRQDSSFMNAKVAPNAALSWESSFATSLHALRLHLRYLRFVHVLLRLPFHVRDHRPCFVFGSDQVRTLEFRALLVIICCDTSIRLRWLRYL